MNYIAKYSPQAELDEHLRSLETDAVRGFTDEECAQSAGAWMWMLTRGFADVAAGFSVARAKVGDNKPLHPLRLKAAAAAYAEAVHGPRCPACNGRGVNLRATEVHSAHTDYSGSHLQVSARLAIPVCANCNGSGRLAKQEVQCS